MKNRFLSIYFTSIILFLFALPNNLLAQSDNATFTLAEAIAYGKKNHLSIKNQQINIAEAKARVKETIAIGIPKVSGTVNWQYFLQLPVSVIPAKFFDPNAGEGEFSKITFGTKNNLTAGIEMKSLVADGTYLLGMKAARMYQDFMAIQTPMVEKQVADAIQDAYLPTLLIVENKKVLLKNVENLKKVLSETRAFNKEGFVEQLDVDRLELSLANLQTELENLDKQQEIAMTALKHAMGLQMSEEISVSDALDVLLAQHGEWNAQSKLNITQRPEYAVLQGNIDLLGMREKVTKVGYYPSIYTFASYQYSAQGNNLFNNPIWAPTAVLGFQLNVPIFDGTQRKYTLERDRLAVELAKNQMKTFERGIELQFQIAQKDHERAQKRVESQLKNLALAEKIYRTAQTKYKEGVGSSLELTQAERELYNVQANLVNARYELLLAKMAIKKALQ